MFGFGSKYLNVFFKMRAYCLQICTANDEHKKFKTINDSRNTVISTNVVGSKHEAKRQDRKFTWDFYE